MCEYGFCQRVDFNPYKNVRVETEGSRSVTQEIADYELTIPMAKELCIIQTTEKGKGCSTGSTAKCLDKTMDGLPLQKCRH